jgi:mono/diheme cytochrome c family protein
MDSSITETKLARGGWPSPVGFAAIWRLARSVALPAVPVLAATLTVVLSAVAAPAATAADGSGQSSVGSEPTQAESTGETDSAEETESAEETGSAEETERRDAQLRQGQQAYSQICSSCHQPGGAGLAGQYPPLLDNPNVDDPAYIRDVIENGRQGRIEVGGEVYDGVMPSFSTLAADEVDAIIAFIQAGFEAPAGEVAAQPTGPVAGTELPALTNLSALVAYLLAFAVAGLVLTPRLISENSRLNTPWLDAWLKTGVIVAAVVLLTVIIPDWAMKQGPVTRLSRIAQDVIGTGLWMLGLGALLLGLWYAHRESRI